MSDILFGYNSTKNAKNGKHKPLSEALGYIDKPIIGIVVALNILGFKTIFSCAGYCYNGHWTESCSEECENCEENKFDRNRQEPSVVFTSSLKSARLLSKVVDIFQWRVSLQQFSGRYVLHYTGKDKKDAWNLLKNCLKEYKDLIDAIA